MKSNMYFVKFFSCIVLILFLFSQNTTAQEIICGQALNDILSDICMESFQNLPLPKKKKSARYPELTHYGLDGGEAGTDVGPSPFMYGRMVNAMAKTRRRRQKGISYECCRKGCTYTELQTFCKDMEII